MSRCFRLLTDNFLDDQVFANINTSSAQTSFPVSNTFDKKRRAKIWRSEGFFNVTSSNNTIVFEESVGVDLTATIAMGEYTSVSDLLVAVKAALEAVGGSTYTVSQDSTTLKLKIESDGSGGGGILTLEWSNGSTTASDLLGFSSASDDTGALSYLADFLRIHSEEFVTVDLGLPTNITSFVASGRRNVPINLSTSGTYKIQASPTDAWSSPAFSQTLTADDEVIAALSESGLADQAYRYWRFSMVDKQNPDGFLELSSMFFGNHFDSAEGAVQFPWRSGFEDESDTIKTEGGTTFSTVKQKTQDFSVRWFNLKKEDVEELENIFDEFGTSSPFWVSMDSGAVYSTAFNRRLVYVKLQNMDVSLIRPNIFEVTQVFREEI